MKQLLTFGLIFTIATSGFLFTACEGEDGEPGPAGEKGDTGANGVGFDETTQYGNIVVRYKGTRIDNAAFDKTIDYKFSSTGPDLANTSAVWQYSGEGDVTTTEFDINRYSAPFVSYGEGSSNSNIRLHYYHNSNGDSYVEMSTYVAIISDDMKFFNLSFWNYGYDASDVITDYAFTAATGDVKFKFKTVIPANDEGNNTGHDIEITADVTAKVLQGVASND